MADTAPIRLALSQAIARSTVADSALAAVRQQVLIAAAAPRVDSLDPKLQRRHDSLTNVLTDLQRLIGKVETAPLPTSYRALAASPALIANPRIIALLDSLSDVEGSRDRLASTDAADPRFVALTSRAAEIGRSIEEIGSVRRDSLLVTITRMTAPSQQVVDARAAAPDTMPWIAERDSSRAAVGSSNADLVRARRQLEDNRQEIERSQEISVISASPFAMVVAAAIFGIVFGFAGALRSELREPTVASGAEIERATGARIMATVAPLAPSSEEERRRANRIAPKYLDFSGDAYRLAYLHVEQSTVTPDVVAIVGDDPDVSAIVAMNLAAIAIEDARSVLVIDSAGRSAAIRSLLPHANVSDLADVIDGRRSWIDATAHIPVGRDKTIDVVTSTRSATPTSVVDLLRRDKQALGRDYDTVFLVGNLDTVVILDGEVVGGAVVTATVGRTPLRVIVEAERVMREHSCPVFGIVVWDAAPPRLEGRPARRGGGDRSGSASPQRPTPAQQPATA